MPIVGIILGLVLAAWISVFTLFNDVVLRQPMMTGNLMPTSVYGPLVLLTLLGCGWSYGRLHRRQVVTRRDLVVLVVIGTAACAWPGTNFLRTFVGSTGNIANLARDKPAWQNTQALRYLPGQADDQPAGEGLLLADGQEQPGVTDTLILGAAEPDVYRLGNVPWDAWWPVLRLWGGIALAMGLASVCLAVIVHPQWARYERLPYPLVRFVEELSRPAEDAAGLGHGRPAILQNKLFWLGLGGVMLVHLLNGLWAWDVRIMQIPLTYNFSPLMQLFPNASRIWGSQNQFFPTIFFSVTAFVFFIRGDVSFSVGLSSFLWLALGAVLLSHGSTLGNDPIETDAGPLLRAGAYIGFAAMILFLGRRYYFSILRGAVGWPGAVARENRAAVWALRGLLFCAALVVGLAWRYTGLDWRLGLCFVVLTLLTLLIVARLSAETGLFYLEPNWMPVIVLAAFFGFEGLGPTAYLTLALLSSVLVGTSREALSGYAVNALALTDKVGGKQRVGKVALGFAAVATLTLGLAMVATLVLTYTRGLSPDDPWGTRWHPSGPFDALSRKLSEVTAYGRLDDILTQVQAGHFAAGVPEAGALAWLMAGLALVVGLTFARLRIAWWPLHPVLILVMGTAPVIRVGWSFLLGWMLRQAVLRLGGTKAFYATLPLAVGAIAGELLAALGWQACGVTYYYITGLIPPSYYILPN